MKTYMRVFVCLLIMHLPLHARGADSKRIVELTDRQLIIPIPSGYQYDAQYDSYLKAMKHDPEGFRHAYSFVKKAPNSSSIMAFMHITYLSEFQGMSAITKEMFDIFLSGAHIPFEDPVMAKQIGSAANSFSNHFSPSVQVRFERAEGLTGTPEYYAGVQHFILRHNEASRPFFETSVYFYAKNSIIQISITDFESRDTNSSLAKIIGWMEKIIETNGSEKTMINEQRTKYQLEQTIPIVYKNNLYRIPLLLLPSKLTTYENSTWESNYRLDDHQFTKPNVLFGEKDQYSEKEVMSGFFSTTEFFVSIYSDSFSSVFSDSKRLEDALLARILKTNVALVSSIYADHKPNSAVQYIETIEVENQQENPTFHSIFFQTIKGKLFKFHLISRNTFYPLNMLHDWQEALKSANKP